MIILNLLVVLLTAGLPLFLLAFSLVSWALHRSWLVGDTVKEIQANIEALGKTQKDKKSAQKLDPALGKWFRFGGGFYGLMALYTWLLIEWADAANFLLGLGDIVMSFDPRALVRLVIKFFFESLVNFVVAVAWPVYWLREAGDFWTKLLVAYGGYWLGISTAHYAWRRGWVADAINRITAKVQRKG